MRILITGAAGFLGQRLARRLLSNPNLQHLTLVDLTPPPVPNSDSRVSSLAADLARPTASKVLVSADITAVYHLAAVVSGQAEANFDLGMAVNCDGTRYLLEAVRHQAPGAKFIFASSLAVFGGDLPEVIADNTVVQPQSSYGTEKAICELWINDYTRKGFIDGRVLRLPTVCVRPGKPNAAASSFASGIIREPLQGETAVCPVDPTLSLWLSSPTAVVNNLIHALSLESAQFTYSRTLNLPGITVTVASMIDALEAIAGQTVSSRISYQPDQAISEIVASWPSRFDTKQAVALGFEGDRNFQDIIHSFIAETDVKECRN
ncbi:NAD dependent epimerase/dehydratase family [Synechococcus sp. PCC 7335]|uniref:D-erythronate dehydrogenase n=1 Tax=Synechococcus sp. (strain ATCC 29403 / PCC 7335) TaxID=91464 RepID=UPI00017EC716|nr:D-erythronate dehydrogenase [Synechococcus sp. PCC 7335]EDX87329.1 NAD dependent epimerase/dehydratase family [Synechococcus sp. PCC 7335]